MLEETDVAVTVGVQRPGPNVAAGCNWKSPTDNEITVCPTNPMKIQRRRKCKKEAQRRRQLEQEGLEGNRMSTDPK